MNEVREETIVSCERPGEADAEARASVRVDAAQLLDDFTDYSRAVVRKPWGYEYLIFSGPTVAVWVLHIKKGAQTSMHCHPGKTTSLVVLDGEAQCSTLEHNPLAAQPERQYRNAAESVMRRLNFLMGSTTQLYVFP